MTIKKVLEEISKKMMKCFTIFNKEKSSKSGKGQGRSAPELRNTNKSDNSAGKNRAIRSASLPRSIPEMYKEKEQNLRVFSLSELRQATSDFNRMLKLGEGGFGGVYKGKIRPPDGQGDPIVVAIKKLNTAGLQVKNESCSKVRHDLRKTNLVTYHDISRLQLFVISSWLLVLLWGGRGKPVTCRSELDGPSALAFFDDCKKESPRKVVS